MDDEHEVYIVHLQRRTLPEQVEWLILQVSFLVAKVNRLEQDSEALARTVKTLENRLRAVERATPLQAPPKPPPPKLPPKRRP